MTTHVKQRIYWKESEQRQVLEEAARLAVLNPSWNHLRLIREGQKVLPLERRRTLQMVSWQGPFKWFADQIDEYIHRAHLKKEEQTEVLEEVAPSVVQGELLSESMPEPEGEVSQPSMIEILSTLVKALEELKDSHPKKEDLPIGIVGRLDMLQERLDRIEGKFQQFMEQGMMFRVVPANWQPPIQQVQVPAPPVQRGSRVEVPPPPPQPEVKTRKPRVVVLNTDSGHVRDGIKKGVEGYVSALKFEHVFEAKTPHFNDFDYVLAYKKTPLSWVEIAKKFYPAGKFKAICGGALPMAAAIRSLPPIEIKD